MPVVSVIIPTYNRALMVREAIRSVLDQTYADYEIIVVDDGSEDDTRDMVAGLGVSVDKVKYIYQKNRGRSAARNRGIQGARGELIAFLDADDRFLPHKLEKQVQVLKEHPEYGMTYGYAIGTDENGKVWRRYNQRRRLSGWVYPQLLFIKGTIITTPSVMVRARVLREIGDFDETMHMCEDLDLWRRVARRHEVHQFEEPLCYVRYRRNEGQPWADYVQARSSYYRKAIGEDAALTKGIETRLFSEMYWRYGVGAICSGNVRFGLGLWGRGVRMIPDLLYGQIRRMTFVGRARRK